MRRRRTRPLYGELTLSFGEFFDFAPVMFEPKPIQKPYPPILVGGALETAPAFD